MDIHQKQPIPAFEGEDQAWPGMDEDKWPDMIDPVAIGCEQPCLALPGAVSPAAEPSRYGPWSTARWTQLAFHDMLGSIYFRDALGACPTAMRGTPSTMKRPAMAVPPAALGHSHALRPRTARHLPSFVEAQAQRGGGLMPRETGDKIWI